MFEEILISALSEFDDDTLEYILESCTEDELNYIDMAIEEMMSPSDVDQLASGYKLDIHNGVKGFIKSFKNSGKDKWKNLAHDTKTEIARIKNNLKGDPENTSLRLGEKSSMAYQNTHKMDDSPESSKALLNAYKSDKDYQRNTNSLSYKIGQHIANLKYNR